MASIGGVLGVLDHPLATEDFGSPLLCRSRRLQDMLSPNASIYSIPVFVLPQY